MRPLYCAPSILNTFLEYILLSKDHVFTRYTVDYVTQRLQAFVSNGRSLPYKGGIPWGSVEKKGMLV